MIIKMMPVFAAVAQLAKLRADEARIDQQIQDTQAALKLAQKRVSECLAQRYGATNEPRVEIPEDLMKEEDSFERLLQALEDMKAEITKQIRPVEEQLIQTNLDHLRYSFSEETQNLSKCLEQIDDRIMACRKQLEEYEHICASLDELKRKMDQIGAGPGEIPDRLPISDFGQVVQQRLEYLRFQGKI
jgi:DNA repair exonuclease SbcCD ATPase subunit